MDTSPQSNGRFALLNAFYDVAAPHLPSIAREVWLLLWRHADTSGVALLSRRRMSGTLSYSRTYISEGIKRLREHNMIDRAPGGFGYIISLPPNHGFPTSQPQLTPQSTMVNTHQQGESTMVNSPVNHGLHPAQPWLTPQSTIVDTLQNSTYKTVFTEQHIHNKNVPDGTGRIQQKPFQDKLPGTKKGDWQAKASTTGLFTIFNAYPAKSRRCESPKLLQPIWDECASEEPGRGQERYTTLLAKVIAHLEKKKHCWDWQKENGIYMPGIINYLKKRMYREPLDTIETSGIEDIDEDQPF